MKMKRTVFSIIIGVLCFMAMSCGFRDNDTKYEDTNESYESHIKDKDERSEEELKETDQKEDESFLGNLISEKKEEKEEFSLEGARAFLEMYLTDKGNYNNEKIINYFFPPIIDCFVENNVNISGGDDSEYDFEYEIDLSKSGILTDDELNEIVEEYKGYDSYFPLSSGAYIVLTYNDVEGVQWIGYADGEYYCLGGAALPSSEDSTVSSAE